MRFIYGNGMHEEDLIDLLALMLTNFNGVLAKLDLDSGVDEEDYLSNNAISMVSGIITSAQKAIRDQGSVVEQLDHVIAKIASLNAQLDGDATVTGANFASLWDITDIVGGSHDSIQNTGIYQGCVVNMLNDIIATMTGVNAKLDADGTVNGTNYGSLWNITDTVDTAGTVASVS